MHAKTEPAAVGEYVLRELRPDNLPHLMRLYDRHVIPDRILDALAAGATEFRPDSFCGMLHTSTAEGRSEDGTARPPLAQSWREWLAPPEAGGAVYRGKLLYPAGSREPAAFATWWEPVDLWAGSAAYTDRVRRVIETLRIPKPGDRDWLLENAAAIVLSDTICGPRWSRHVCLDAVREWLSAGFRHALVYRHTRLIARRAGAPERLDGPRIGCNARSDRVLRAKGHHDVGTRLGDTLAVRCDGRVWVLPEEGWMVADLAESLRLLEAAVR